MAGLTKLVGIYGGTFDPPHKGHLLLAKAALDQLGLRQVLWVLTRRSPHKKTDAITPVEIRLHLVEVALAEFPEFMISRIEIDRTPPYYAVDTLRLLQAADPAASLVYLMGEDALRDLPTWHRPLELIATCQSIGVLKRSGYEVDLDQLEGQLPGVTEKIHWINVPKMNISASMIRSRVRQNKAYKKYVVPAVADLIENYHLYKEEA